MKKNLILTAACLIVLAFGAYSVSAQISITIPNIPKLPKIKKDKPQKTVEQTKSTTETVQQTNDNQSSAVVESKENQTNDAGQTVAAVNQIDGKCENGGWMMMVMDELAEMQKDIDAYTPARGWLYNKVGAYDYLIFAISPRAKQNWLKSVDRVELADCPNLVAAFDKLEASYKKVLPSITPDKNGYAIQNPATENLMKAKIRDLANHKIFHAGVKQANWLIEKNSLDIPTARYKHGMVWVRYTPDDHPYCRVYYINIVQDYAGGGTYGASYANFVKEALVACPAGTK